MTATNGLVDELIDQLSVKTVFTIPIFGGIKIAESVVVMWIIMAIVIVASIFLTRKLSVENPGKRQLFLEVCIGKFYGFFEGLLGEEGKCYIPYLMSVGLFIGIANVIGLFGFKPPTKDLNCTIALALMSIILVEAAGIRAKGVNMNTNSRNVTYSTVGDYQLPNLTLNQPRKPLGKYGRLRRTYLKDHRPVLYNTMLLNGSLYPHLMEVEQTAESRMQQTMAQLLKQNPAPNKEQNQMAWVQHMNSLRAQAEELVLMELIYS